MTWACQKKVQALDKFGSAICGRLLGLINVYPRVKEWSLSSAIDCFKLFNRAQSRATFFYLQGEQKDQSLFRYIFVIFSFSRN